VNLSWIEACQGEEFATQDAVFVDRLIACGRQSPMRDKLGGAEDAQNRIGVANIEGKQH
jgi:hypothetical protein